MKKTYLKSFCARCLTLLVLALLSTNLAWGATTVTYKQSSTSDASVSSGTAPTGSSVAFSNTYTNNKEQLTNNNSMTYTLKGYAGYKITSLKMSMKSNSSAGTGKFSLVAGTTTLAEIASNTAFNQPAWYGNWSTSYVDVTPTMSKTDYVIQNGEDVVLTISASVNSLYCQSITITYEEGTTPAKNLVSIAVSGIPDKTTYEIGETFDPTGLVVTGTYDEGAPEVITSGITWNVTPSPLTVETTSVSVTATVSGKTSPAYVVNGLTVTEKPVLPSYTLVTDASTLMDGDVIVLGAVKDDTWYVNAGINGKYLDKADATCKDDILESEEAVEITLEKTTDGWYLKIENQYINTTAAKALTFANDASTVWTIDIDKNGLATIAAGDYGRFLYNVNSPRFLNYTSSTDASMLLPKIFKKETAPASADVTISSVGWATVCLPFKATITSGNATAYYVTTSGSILNKVEANVIPAGEGVLLKSNEGGAATVTFTETAVAADEVKANYMKGSVAGETFDESGYKYYILANGGKGLGFYYQGADNTTGSSVTCAAGKAVLAVPETAGAKAFFSLDDEPTGITSYENDNDNENLKAMTVYNLNGMRVNGNYKGIVIMNGKKYINK